VSALLTLLAILGWIAAAALGLLLTVLLFPVHLRARGAVRDGEPSGRADVRWAFGAVSVAATPEGVAARVAGLRIWRKGWRELLRRAKAERKPGKAKAGRAPEEREAEAGEGGRSRGRALREHRRTLLRMAARFGRALHLRLRARGAIGLYDPIDTAALAGALELLGQAPGVELELEIDWLDETLEGEAEGAARVWVPELLTVAVALLFRRESRVAAWALVSGA
jgi:hypothetical protein